MKMKVVLLLICIHAFILSVTAQDKSTYKCEQLLAKLSNEHLDYMIIYPSRSPGKSYQVMFGEGTLPRRIADEYGNAILTDLVLLLNDEKRDYAANLLLYSISGRSLPGLTFYKIDEWRRYGKKRDVAYWKEYIWRISFPPSDTGRLLEDVRQELKGDWTFYDPYQLFYNTLRDDDASEYQLLVMSDLLSTPLGGTLYYNIADSCWMMYNAGDHTLTGKSVSNEVRMEILQQLSGIKKGNYFSIEDKHSSAAMQCLYIVKKGAEVIFQYQGINKDLLEFEHTGDERIQAVIQIVKQLTKGKL